MTNSPAVSVIVPMYNVENYIGDTLDSVLAQNFSDYELIVVNDCSTDNCRAVAETYLEKFGGRMKIFDNEKNSGVSVARNNGLRNSSGEYVFFLDSDDLLAPVALGDMYALAKRFNADIVHSTKRANMSEDGTELTPAEEKNPLLPPDVVMIEENLRWRISFFLKKRFSFGAWRKFSRRKFLLENNLLFPENVRFAEDQTWTYGVFFCAKRIVHVPRVFYYCRRSKDSLCRTKRTSVQNVILWLRPLVGGIKWIDDAMSRVRFFQKNPRFRHAVLESFAGRYFKKIFKHSLKLKQREIYGAIKKTFGGGLGAADVLISELITFVNTQQKKIAKLEEQLKTQ